MPPSWHTNTHGFSMLAQSRSIRLSGDAVAAASTEHGEPKRRPPQSLLFLLASSTTNAQPKPIAGFGLGGRDRFIEHVAGPTHTPVHQPKALSGVCLMFLLMLGLQLLLKPWY